MLYSTVFLLAVASIVGLVMWSIVLVVLIRAAWTGRQPVTRGTRRLATTGQRVAR